MGSGEHPDAMVVIAALVSRVDAIVTASMLEAAGIIVRVDGLHHASVQVNSLALGGHRLWVPASQWLEASDIIREVGSSDNWTVSLGLRRAVLKFLALWVGLQAGFCIVAIALGSLTPASLLAIPFSALGVPVNPQGRGDYYLVKTAE